VRFPGLISALTLPAGGTSDYAPEMIHAAARGEQYGCFVRPDTQIPFMAMPDGVEALLTLASAPRDRLQRTAAWIEAMDGGLDYLRAVVVDDSLGIAADLDAMMVRHVGSYVDEWKSTVDDPDRLARFVSFVNAPDQPDPTIEFGSERGQPVPVMLGSRA